MSEPIKESDAQRLYRAAQNYIAVKEECDGECKRLAKAEDDFYRVATPEAIVQILKKYNEMVTQLREFNGEAIREFYKDGDGIFG